VGRLQVLEYGFSLPGNTVQDSNYVSRDHLIHAVSSPRWSLIIAACLKSKYVARDPAEMVVDVADSRSGSTDVRAGVEALALPRGDESD
jgi:hypothetical protein